METAEQLLRDFNRAHTRHWHLLESRYLHSPHSLPEARALFEIASAPAMTPTMLANILDLDRGYVSRLVASLRRRGFIELKADGDDGRSRRLHPTRKGVAAFGELQSRANLQAGEFLQSIAPARRPEVLRAFRTLRDEMAAPQARARPEVTIRKPRAGDLGVILERHAVHYSRELGWGLEFEGYVAQTLAKFALDHDPASERIWIAESAGSFVGCVGMVKARKDVAQLRWLLVEPEARGLGVGAKLTDEVIRFARARNYAKLFLITESSRESARAIYEKRGFTIVKSRRARPWGSPVIEEHWELPLQ